jgi:hypothetical protein
MKDFIRGFSLAEIRLETLYSLGIKTKRAHRHDIYMNIFFKFLRLYVHSYQHSSLDSFQKNAKLGIQQIVARGKKFHFVTFSPTVHFASINCIWYFCLFCLLQFHV